MKFNISHVVGNSQKFMLLALIFDWIKYGSVTALYQVLWVNIKKMA